MGIEFLEGADVSQTRPRRHDLQTRREQCCLAWAARAHKPDDLPEKELL